MKCHRENICLDNFYIYIYNIILQHIITSEYIFQGLHYYLPSASEWCISQLPLPLLLIVNPEMVKLYNTSLLHLSILRQLLFVISLVFFIFTVP